MFVNCLICDMEFEIKEDDKSRICRSCMSPKNMSKRIDRLARYSKPPFSLEKDE